MSSVERMGCLFVKLCFEWRGYKTTGGKLGTPASESSHLLNGDNKQPTAQNAFLYQTPGVLLGEATRQNDGDVIEQSVIPKDLLVQEQSLQLPAENINTSFNADNISESYVASLTSSLASDCPSTTQADRPPDILGNTIVNDCIEDAISPERNKSTDETETSLLSTTRDCHFPDFQIEQVLKEYQDLVEECAVLKNRVQAIEAEIEMERAWKSEQLDSLQKQLAEVTSKYQFLHNKTNLMLFMSGIPLLMLVFAIMMLVYPALGMVTSTSS